MSRSEAAVRAATISNFFVRRLHRQCRVSLMAADGMQDSDSDWRTDDGGDSIEGQPAWKRARRSSPSSFRPASITAEDAQLVADFGRAVTSSCSQKASWVARRGKESIFSAFQAILQQVSSSLSFRGITVCITLHHCKYQEIGDRLSSSEEGKGSARGDVSGSAFNKILQNACGFACARTRRKSFVRYRFCTSIPSRRPHLFTTSTVGSIMLDTLHDEKFGRIPFQATQPPNTCQLLLASPPHPKPTPMDRSNAPPASPAPARADTRARRQPLARAHSQLRRQLALHGPPLARPGRPGELVPRLPTPFPPPPTLPPPLQVDKSSQSVRRPSRRARG